MLKSRIAFFIVVIAISAAYTGGCRRAGAWLVKDDAPPHADAMVILMGNFPERVLQAVDLWQEGRADRIIIVEEGMGPYRRLEERGVRIETNSEQAMRALVTLGIPADSITLLPGDALSTITEANIISRYLADHPNIDTLLLVSSPYHMRRASMIFMAVFRNAQSVVSVSCSPSKYTDFDADRWWRDKEDVQVVLSEFVKICSFVVFERRKI